MNYRKMMMMLPVDAQDLEQNLIELQSAVLPHWCLFSISLSPLKWAKNNLPRCRGHELEGTPCPLLESTCSNYCSPTSSHGSCAEIAEDNMTKWWKPESRQIHHPPLGWGWVFLVRARMKDRRLCALLHVSAVASLHSWIVIKGVLV